MKFSLPDFNVGMAVEIKFTSPQSDKVVFNLHKDDQNYNLNISIKYDSNELNLNTKEGGSWPYDKKVSVGDRYDFRKGVPVTVKVEAKQGYFDISINGNHLSKFEYRSPVTDVTGAAFNSDVKLESFSIYF
ncbi:32 kDa beta-galactoside-binding lectin lec-3-like [Dysidea avara]|uniref:32 kDa beta-galactoside-binding lectin lec-3-like n=1 Tax=Dysidea avara TaxID=196820 RepID=UPI00332250C2